MRPDTVGHVWKGGAFKVAYEYEMQSDVTRLQDAAVELLVS